VATVATAGHASSSPPLLDPPELNVTTTDNLPVGIDPRASFPSVAFRHSGWSGLRGKVRSAMVSAGVTPARLVRFDVCGSGAWVWSHPDQPGSYRITSDHCHDRWCVPCARERSRIIASAIASAITPHQTRLVTLTLKSTTEPLTELIDKLYASFRALRRRSVWEDAVDGSIALLELVIGKDGIRWHPHLHILAVGRYIHQPDLSAAWHSITGDSYIVDVRAIRNPELAIAYVAKYASKPPSASLARNPDKLKEAVIALHGRRLCLTTGCFRGVKLSGDDEPSDLHADGWFPLAPLSDLITSAGDGDAVASRIITALQGDRKCQSNPKSPPSNYQHRLSI